MPVKIKIDQVILEKVSFGHTGEYLSAPPTSAAVGQTAFRGTLEVFDEPVAVAVGLQATTVPRDSTASPGYEFDIRYRVLLLLSDGVAPNETERRELMTHGIAYLVPFVREAVASLSGRGRFGPVWLQPINVAAMVESMNMSLVEVPPTAAPLAATSDQTPARKTRNVKGR
jgi:hypothetical protein